MKNKFLHTALIVPTLAIGLTSFCSAIPSAMAQEQGTSAPFIDIIPTVMSSEEAEGKYIPPSSDDPIIRVTPDKSELVHLDEPASSIIIGNPTHINILADNSTTLVIVPRVPGATHFTVLGKDGKALMQRHVIVASPKQDYVRIKKTCAGDDEACQKTSVYYCPDMCHEIGIQGGDKESSSKSGEAGGNGGDSDISSEAEEVKPEVDMP